MSTKTPTPGLHARELMFSPADVQRLEDVKEMYSLLLGRSVSNSDAVRRAVVLLGKHLTKIGRKRIDENLEVVPRAVLDEAVELDRVSVRR